MVYTGRMVLSSADHESSSLWSIERFFGIPSHITRSLPLWGPRCKRWYYDHDKQHELRPRSSRIKGQGSEWRDIRNEKIGSDPQAEKKTKIPTCWSSGKRKSERNGAVRGRAGGITDESIRVARSLRTEAHQSIREPVTQSQTRGLSSLIRVNGKSGSRSSSLVGRRATRNTATARGLQ